MQILNSTQIQQKIKRLAFQILEVNHDETKIFILGINNNGYSFAQRIKRELNKISELEIILSRVRLNPASPITDPIELDIDTDLLKNKCILLVDDVANTGRTLFYSFQPLLKALPKKIEVAVLVDRKHKSFPVKVDYVGLSLATTVQEHIDVNLNNLNEMSVVLN